MSLTQPNGREMNQIAEYIKVGIQAKVIETFENLKIEFLKDLDSRKNTICAGILIDITKQIDFVTQQDRTVITIRNLTKDEIR